MPFTSGAYVSVYAEAIEQTNNDPDTTVIIVSVVWSVFGCCIYCIVCILPSCTGGIRFQLKFKNKILKRITFQNYLSF